MNAVASSILAAAIAGTAQAPWLHSGFGAPEFSTVDLSPYYGTESPAARGRLGLGFVILRGSGWTPAMLEPRLRELTAAYSACGVRFTHAEIVVADPPEGRTKFTKYDEAGDHGLLPLVRKLPTDRRPLYLLFAGYEDEEDDRAFSSAPFETGPVLPPPMHDIVYMPFGVTSAEYARERESSPYSVFVHELAHVLTREGQHILVKTPNTMNVWRARSDAILPEHCGKMSSYPGMVR